MLKSIMNSCSRELFSFQQDALEKSWLSWSGAREIYKYSSRSWNLRRISLHKIPKRRIHASRSFAYVMMCEFGSILHPSNRLQALDMCERLRVRNCGYISLYQISSYRLLSAIHLHDNFFVGFCPISIIGLLLESIIH
ncbi:unnamed protein product [Anisakis simplex]|uniref:Pentatricopeptide repeat-containing protein n=1 Tax=Anisakis simplex TaxID=6269 RepID=A0A0M3JEF5_ANISI|nr:unnamed protein product [Anisakis simplex]